MKRLTAGLFVLSAALVGLTGSVPAQGEKLPAIKDVMKKMGGGTTGIYFQLGRELRDPELMWDDARRMSRELVKLTAPLSKCTPPQGDRASWEKHTKALTDAAKTLDDAVAKQDKRAAQTAYQNMGEENMCKKCHDVHRKK